MEAPQVLIKLQLGCSTISALAHIFNPEHPFVSSARLIRNPWHKLIRNILPYLPFRSFIQRLWPIYFLPDTIILKAQDPEAHTVFYHTEKAMYEKLEPLQGHVIPIYYGEACIREEDCGREMKALVLSKVCGILACEQEHHNREKRPVGFADFEQQMHKALAELGCFHVVPGDRKLDNVFLVDGRVMFIDLEMFSEVYDDPECLEACMKTSMWEYTRQYSSYLYDVWDDIPNSPSPQKMPTHIPKQPAFRPPYLRTQTIQPTEITFD